MFMSLCNLCAHWKAAPLMKFIQVGIGGMGNAWLRAVLASKEVDFAGFVEINPAVIEEQTAAYGLNRDLIFPSLDAALAEVQPSLNGESLGVIDVTPPAFHREIALTAMRAGVPVLAEKPLADTLESARAIAQASTELGVLHMVAQNYRYIPWTQTLKSVLDSGVMGRVGAVTLEFFRGPRFSGFRAEMPYPLIIDMSIHHFDLMRFLLESDAVSVFGRSWNPPWSWFKGDASASVLLQFANHVTVTYNASWCSLGKETGWSGNWRFDCEYGVLVLNGDDVFIERPEAAPEFVPLAKPAYTGQEYLLHEFYRAVTQGATPATTVQDNLKSLGIVFDVVASFESGGVVRSSV